MNKYESKVQIPPEAAAQKPGVERYALPVKLAEELQGALPAEEVAGAEWVDGSKLAVSISSEAAIPQAGLEEAQASVQEIVGPTVAVPPFEREDGVG